MLVGGWAAGCWLGGLAADGWLGARAWPTPVCHSLPPICFRQADHASASAFPRYPRRPPSDRMLMWHSLLTRGRHHQEGPTVGAVDVHHTPDNIDDSSNTGAGAARHVS